MMEELVTPSGKLAELEVLLQQRLQLAALVSVPLQVNCLLQENSLAICVDCPDTLSLDPQQVCHSIGPILTTKKITRQYPGQKYLVINGQFYLLEAKKTATPSNPSESYHRNWTKIKQWRSLLTYLSLRLKFPRFKPLVWGLGGAGISLIFLYGLTRPCVIGKCPLIFEAQHLADDALTSLATVSSDTEILTAKQQLAKSLDLLHSIPWWSSYHSDALILEANYEKSYNYLSAMVTAFEITQKAASLSRNYPSSPQEWQKIQQLWQSALKELKTLPNNSSFQALAAIKTEEYQQNLDNITYKLNTEKQGKHHLKTAEEAAKLAQIREDSAQSLADWQLVYATWQTAIKQLQGISPGTTSYEKSRQVLNSYLPELLKVGKRKNQEEFAVNLYNQGIKQAKLAEEAEIKKQWFQAVSYWRTALNLLKQIPNNTFQATHTQPLIITYTIALNQAENNLKNVLKQEKLEGELKEICEHPAQICNYQITDKIIKIKLNSNYTQQVWNTALQAQVQGNLQVQVALLNHLSRLEQSLQIISNQTGKSVEIYNSNGNLTAVYQSRSSGVRQQ